VRQDFRNEKSCRGQQRSAGGSSKREQKQIFANAFCLKKTIALVGNIRFRLLTIILLAYCQEHSLP